MRNRLQQKYLYAWALFWFWMPPVVDGGIGDISTVAGDGVAGFSGDGLAATAARMNRPFGVAVDSSGNVLFSDYLNHRVRRVDGAGKMATVAGFSDGFSGDGSAATSAQFSFPSQIAYDAEGNLYIADQLNHRIRKVDSSGIIATVAGDGTQGFGGDGGAAISAQLDTPFGVAVDSDGNIYIADSFNERIRKVDATTGLIATIAGDGNTGFGGDGGQATDAQLARPFNIVTDGGGNVYFTDQFNFRVRKVSSSGTISTVAGTTFGYSGDGGDANLAQLSLPSGLAIDSAGNLFISDGENHRVRKVDSSGIITTVAGDGTSGFGGDGGSATLAQLQSPNGLAIDRAGNLYIADDFNHRIRKVEGVAAQSLSDYYYGQAHVAYTYFVSLGDEKSGLAFWFYYRAYGDRALREAEGNAALGQKEFYLGLAYFYYTYLTGNTATYYYYLYIGYSELTYYLALGDSATASAYYNFYYALALSVL